MRERPVMMSSTMPSAKYSCSGSPLMFWNGRTAIDGLAGARRGDAVAQMNADAEHQAFVFRLVAVGVGDGLLDLDGSAQRIDRARDLDQRSVAGQLDQPAAIARERRLEPLLAIGLEPRQRAGLVAA